MRRSTWHVTTGGAADSDSPSGDSWGSTRVETNTDIFKQQVNNALRRGVLSGDDSETTFNDYVTEFETATNNLSQDFDARRSTSADVEEVLNRANDINQGARLHTASHLMPYGASAIGNEPIPPSLLACAPMIE